MTDLAYPPVVQALAEASQRIGNDPLLIQAAGGNTSVKDGDTLWVKGSGLWLRDALTRPLFAPVALSQVRARVAANEVDPVGPALLSTPAPPGLRPSIETTLHALMPHRIVLHVHAVDVIAWAVLPDVQAHLAAALEGFDWGWVDYERPGLPLTRVVAAQMQTAAVDVLLMGNHGLVVGADTVAAAEQVLQAVIDRLRRPVRAAPEADVSTLVRIAHDTGWQLPANARCHAVATDPLNLARARRGVLYPDHVVFLGHELTVAPEAMAASLDAQEAANEAALSTWLRLQRALTNPPPYIAVPGRGVLTRDDLPEAAHEMLVCLADVLQRLPDSPEPLYLPAEEALGLANWEAEKFRKTLSR